MRSAYRNSIRYNDFLVATVAAGRQACTLRFQIRVLGLLARDSNCALPSFSSGVKSQYLFASARETETKNAISDIACVENDDTSDRYTCTKMMTFLVNLNKLIVPKKIYHRLDRFFETFLRLYRIHYYNSLIEVLSSNDIQTYNLNRHQS